MADVIEETIAIERRTGEPKEELNYTWGLNDSWEARQRYDYTGTRALQRELDKLRKQKKGDR
jgi:hypothetical protein